MEIRLPDLGEGIESAEVVTILVEPGSKVGQNQPIIVVEGDKATIEVPAPTEGVVAKILVEPGQKLSPGDPVCVLDGAGDTTGEATETEPTGETEKKESQTREPEEQARPPVQTSSDKPSNQPNNSRPLESGSQPEQATPDSAGREKTEVADSGQPAQVSEPLGFQHDPAGSLAKIPASPAARRWARELGVDLTRVEGQGPGGRVTVEDVRAAALTMGNPPAKSPAESQFMGGSPANSREGDTRPGGKRVKLSATRKIIARRMAESWREIPHVLQADEADVTRLERIRRQFKEEIRQDGGSLSLMVFVIRALVACLKKYPEFNCSFDSENQELVYHADIHLGLAVDTEKGLLVPVLPAIQNLSATNLAMEIPPLVKSARAGQIDTTLAAKHTFSLSNLGSVGGRWFTPIINPPDVAILGLMKTRAVPTRRGDKWGHKLFLPLCLSYDHRVIDGGLAARFVNELKELLEAPERLILCL